MDYKIAIPGSLTYIHNHTLGKSNVLSNGADHPMVNKVNRR